MKKLTAILLCLLLTAALAIPAMAAEPIVMTISTETATAKPGDEIEFKVSMSGGEKCSTFGLILEYDSNVFEVVEGEFKLKGVLFGVFDKEKGLACMLSDAEVINGEVGAFTLRVKAAAPSGTYEISGNSSVKNDGAAVESEVEAVKLTISGGTGAQSGSASGDQSGGSSGDQSSGTQNSGTASSDKVTIVIGEAALATQPAAEETTAAEETAAVEETQEASEAPEAVTEEMPAAEEENQEPSEELLIMPAPETAEQDTRPDVPMIAVVAAAVLLAALIVILILKKVLK